MIEVMVASGILGALSLVLTGILKEQFRAERDSTTISNYITISNTIRGFLSHKDSCNQTFRDHALVMGVGTTGDPINPDITEIRNSLGNPIIQEGQVIGDLTIEDIFITGDASVGYTLTASLSRGSPIVGQNTYIRGDLMFQMGLPLQIVGGQFESCFFDTSSFVPLSSEDFCQAIGGSYDRPNNECSLQNYSTAFTPSYQSANILGNAEVGLSTQYLYELMRDTLDRRYINTQTPIDDTSITSESANSNMRFNQRVDINLSAGGTLQKTTDTFTGNYNQANDGNKILNAAEIIRLFGSGSDSIRDNVVRFLIEDIQAQDPTEYNYLESIILDALNNNGSASNTDTQCPRGEVITSINCTQRPVSGIECAVTCMALTPSPIQGIIVDSSCSTTTPFRFITTIDLSWNAQGEYILECTSYNLFQNSENCYDDFHPDATDTQLYSRVSEVVYTAGEVGCSRIDNG